MNEPEQAEKAKVRTASQDHAEEDFRRSMKRRFWGRVGVLVLAVFGYLYIMELTYSYNRYWEGYVAAALGGTVAVIFMSGIAPLLWLALILKFDYRRYAGPLILWCVLAVAVCWMNYTVNSFDRCIANKSVEECLSR